MSHQLINLNSNLRQLRNEGYSLSIQHNHLVVDDIPALNEKKEIIWGRIICPLDSNGTEVLKPNEHIMYWSGEEPRDHNGERHYFYHSSNNKNLSDGLKSDHQFSLKLVDEETEKKRDYIDYYEKVTTYANAFCGPAKSVDPTVTPCVFNPVPIEEGDDSPFCYSDTASSRAGIMGLSDIFKSQKIAIVGLGGTGSYILDLVTKTPVKSITIFDDDLFLQHNAFRFPGAASYKTITEKPNKAEYLYSIYSNIHKNIIAVPEKISEDNISHLSDVNFVFICIDKAKPKKILFEYLESQEIPFIDAGLGVSEFEGKLTGQIRTTLSTNELRGHIRECVEIESENEDNEYSNNAQLADLNALNAAISVIRWKRLLGFYRSDQNEHHSLFRIRDAAHLREHAPGE